LVRRLWHARLLALGATAALLGHAGCSPHCRNEPLEVYDPNAGYRFDVLEPGLANGDQTFVCLTFSGGGTRAAALAYGVLLGLRDTPIAPSDDSPRRTLLDEVDVISAVSGGAFIAAAYGLWEAQALDGRLERDLLYRDVESDLFSSLWRPQNLLRLGSVAFDTIDIAATYYDEELFERQTYTALLARRQRPFIVINATNMGIDRRFEFTQDDFDLLGSDLASVPLGLAVAASSAAPVVFSPLRFRYYTGPPLCSVLEATLTDTDGRQRNARRCEWAASLVPRTDGSSPPRHELDAPNHRYLYLMDGGVVDNLGVSYVLDAYRHGVIRRRIDDGRINRLVLIMVNATNRQPSDIERHESSPGILTAGVKALFNGIDHNSAALTQLVHLRLAKLPRHSNALCAECNERLQASCPSAAEAANSASRYPETFVIEVCFRDLTDPRLRDRFDRLETSLALPRGDVDALIQAGQSLLKAHPEFRRLEQALR